MVSHTRSETRLWYIHAATTGERVPILSARFEPGRHPATGKVTTSQALPVAASGPQVAHRFIPQEKEGPSIETIFTP